MAHLDPRKPEWKGRYSDAAKAYGFPDFTFEFHPYIEAFYKGELKMFDASLGNIQERHPKLEVCIQDLRARVLDPVLGGLYLERVNIPLIAERVKSSRETLGLITSKADQVLMQSPKLREQFDEIISPQRQRTSVWEEILQEAQGNIQDYREYIMKLIEEVMQASEAAASVIYIPGYCPMERETKRNEVYKKIPKLEKFLGWDVKLMARVFRQNTLDNEEKKKVWQDIREDPVAREIIKGRKMKVHFPQPLGKDEVEPAKLFDDILTRYASADEVAELEKAVAEHFVRRYDSAMRTSG